MCPESEFGDSSTAGDDLLAVHPGALGDLVLFGQLLVELRAKHGLPARLAAGGQKARLLAGLGVVDEAIDLDGLPMHEVFGDAPPVECRLPGRLAPCRLLVSCFAAGDEAAERRLAELTRAEQVLFLPVRPPADFGGHLVDLWARQAGLDAVPPPHWRVPGAWRDQARECLRQPATARAVAVPGALPSSAIPWGQALAGVGRRASEWAAPPTILIHPGAGARAKCWPLGQYIELARQLPPAGWGQAVFVVGPAEVQWLGQAVIDGLRREFPVIVEPPLETLAGLCGLAAAFVGNDSGPGHLAAAVGTPTITLFGPSNPVHFAPRGRWVRTIVGHLSTLPDAEVLSAVAWAMKSAAV